MGRLPRAWGGGAPAEVPRGQGDLEYIYIYMHAVYDVKSVYLVVMHDFVSCDLTEQSAYNKHNAIVYTVYIVYHVNVVEQVFINCIAHKCSL